MWRTCLVAQVPIQETVAPVDERVRQFATVPGGGRADRSTGFPGRAPRAANLAVHSSSRGPECSLRLLRVQNAFHSFHPHTCETQIIPAAAKNCYAALSGCGFRCGVPR